MRPSLKKRFWTDVTVVDVEDGFTVHLDARDIRTPAKAPMVVPTRAIADMIAAEWDAQVADVKPDEMPATRAANAAIDKVSVNKLAIIDMLAEYGASDLLCYRSLSPQKLIDRQVASWDPILAWVKVAHDAPLNVTNGVMYIEQPAQSVANMRAALLNLTPFQLSAVHDLITISGSMVLGLAVIANHLDMPHAWDASHVDEIWQKEQWGVDEDAEVNDARKYSDFTFAHQFWISAI